VIAALYVERDGVYYGLPDVDPWDAERDARLYPGPHPVVAHPPCARWSRLAGLVEARWGYRRGDDGGCFASALASVRRWGGVLEHPAYSDAWATFGLPRPPRGGGWQRGVCGGWSTHVEQGHYGHAARKATWLYAFGVGHLPALRWGPARGTALVSWCGNHLRGRPDDRPRLSKATASRTPLEFRDVLLDLARSSLGHSRTPVLETGA
jgi:hypothetical protein